MIKVFITNFRKYGEWFLGDIKCDEYDLFISDYIFTKENMKKLWHGLDNIKHGEEMYMLLNEDEILEIKNYKNEINN